MQEKVTTISLKHRLEYALLRGCEALLKPLPLSMVEALGRGLGSLVWLVFPIRFAVVATNLENLYPHLPRPAKMRLMHRIYRHHGYLFLTYLTMSRKGMQKKILAAPLAAGRGCFEAALEKGRGGVLTGIHFGHWEASGGWLVGSGYPLSAIYRTQKNPLVDRYFTAQRLALAESIRQMPRESVSQFVKELKTNRLLAVAMDQRVGRQGTPVRFMNRTARVPKGAAFLHLRTGAPLLWSAFTVKGKGFSMETGALSMPVYPRVTEAAINAITARVLAHYETVIRKNPEQWFWFHKLWDKRSYPRHLPRSFTDIRESLLVTNRKEVF